MVKQESVGRAGISASCLVGLLTSVLLPMAGRLLADDLEDHFSNGVERSRWAFQSNQPLFAWDATAGNVLLSKPAGGTGVGVESIRLVLSRHAEGDFDVSVEFSAADLDRLGGGIGNQAQLDLRFGDQQFVLVRSDEAGAGENAHVFAAPPGTWYGAISTADAAGILRITRVGATVTGYYNGTPLYQATLNAAPVSLIALELQNNQTTDPISVRFDNFSLTADRIGLFADGFESGDLSAWSLQKAGT